jgi:hypothetical protein
MKVFMSDQGPYPVCRRLTRDFQEWEPFPRCCVALKPCRQPNGYCPWCACSAPLHLLLIWGHLYVAGAQDLAQHVHVENREEEMIPALPQNLSLSAQDLALDIPDAQRLLSSFLGRAVVDELLPPSFLTSVLPSLKDDSMGVAVVQMTGAGSVTCRC